MRILVVEDNPKLSAALKAGLEREGYTVDTAVDGVAAEVLIKKHRDDYGLVVLDIVLPGRDGFAVCRGVRKAGIAVPVLALTARDSVDDRVAGLDAGMDDYMVKPFAFEELTARVRALLRRPRHAAGSVLSAAGITLDSGAFRVSAPRGDVKLTRKEFRLLELLMNHTGQVLSRDQIVRKLWGVEGDPGSNAVDVHVKNLRRKLIEGGSAEVVETIRGLGYRFTG
jgi:DNA-binding response OmpR family regulator